uniref:Uncharacterized protein n=1 Tax=Anguilla anguilla TaxID=7936 RepID=A0A0E9RCR0_ANGAN
MHRISRFLCILSVDLCAQDQKILMYSVSIPLCT